MSIDLALLDFGRDAAQLRDTVEALLGATHWQARHIARQLDAMRDRIRNELLRREENIP